MFQWIVGFFNAEWVHYFTLWLLSYVPACFFKKTTESPVHAMGLVFKHPVCLAAGFDKNGDYLKALSKLGFAAIELGTVTPKPQFGNPKPRLFRVPSHRALINRMGFNNAGVDALVENLKKTSFDGVIGVSIGPNKETPANRILSDYGYCLRQVYLYADYVAVNVSSPNTPGLRALQHKKAFSELISTLVDVRHDLIKIHDRYVPIVVKVSPDETDEAIKSMTALLLEKGIDGMILTNTTLSRAGIQGLSIAKEIGGVSGKPLAQRAMQCLKSAKSIVGDHPFTLIASGGVYSVTEGVMRLQAGANLLQVYSGLVYQGPDLVVKLTKAAASDSY